MSLTKYVCEITSKTFNEKSQIDKHLKSKSFKQQCCIKKLELEKISKSKLKKIYGTLNINKIIKKISCIEKKENKYKLIKQKKDGSIYHQLDKKEKKNKELEKKFKNEFKNKLKKWHNILSGCGVTGDPAFDDIINILIICYLEPRISDTGKYDFLNLDKYNILNQKKIQKYLECFSIQYIKDNTIELTKSTDIFDCKSIFYKIGFILSHHPLTKKMFLNEDFINCNKDTILSKLIYEIYNYSKEKDIFKYQDLVGIAYEFWLNEYQGNSGKELGNYFTERDLMLMTFHLLDKKDVKKYITNNSIIGDEFCGTFGFPLYLKQFLKNKFNIKIKNKNIYGVEIGERHSRLAMINGMFSLDDFSNIKRGDGFITNLSEHLDLSVHNVPFGKRISYINTKEYYEHYKGKRQDIPKFTDIIPINVGKCDAPIASQMVIYKTKHLGLCIIKDGQETTGVGRFIKYRKYFCDSCNIKKILKIPGGIFSSTGTKTICIYFVKGEQTKKIEFMELNNECDTITRLVKVSYNDLKHNNYSWDPNIYIIDEQLAEIMENSNCKFKKLGDICEFMPKSKRKASYGKNIGKYNFYTSSYKIKKCDEYDYQDECIIIGTGGNANIKIDKIFSCSADNFIIKTAFNKYIYYYFLNNIFLLKNGFKGSGIRHLSREYLKNIQIPIPSKDIQEKCIKQLDLLDTRKQGLEKDNIMIDKQMKYYLENQIKKNLDNIEIKKLGDICEFMPKSKRKASYGKNIGKYNFYTSSYKIKKCNEYNYQDECIIIGDGGNVNIKIDKNFSCSDHNIIIKTKINKYIYYFLLNNLYLLENGFNGACLKNISKNYIKNIQIIIPSKDIQEKSVKYLDKLEKNKENNNIMIEQLNELMKSILEQSYYSNNKINNKTIVI